MTSDRVQEWLGKLLLTAIFAWPLTDAARGIGEMLTGPAPLQPLALLNRGLSLAFVTLVVVMTVRRLPARSNAAGWVPRLDAICGTFLLILLIWLPAGRPPQLAEAAATLLILTGTAASIWCLAFLGRSFAVLAAARSLVTQGPYGLVRHPLYVAEAVTTLGIILSHWSVGALGLGLAQLAFQLRRIRHEEAVLRAAFPDYADYARRVPMLLPRLP